MRRLISGRVSVRSRFRFTSENVCTPVKLNTFSFSMCPNPSLFSTTDNGWLSTTTYWFRAFIDLFSPLFRSALCANIVFIASRLRCHLRIGSLALKRKSCGVGYFLSKSLQSARLISARWYNSRIYSKLASWLSIKRDKRMKEMTREAGVGRSCKFSCAETSRFSFCAIFLQNE